MSSLPLYHLSPIKSVVAMHCSDFCSGGRFLSCYDVIRTGGPDAYLRTKKNPNSMSFVEFHLIDSHFHMISVVSCQDPNTQRAAGRELLQQMAIT